MIEILITLVVIIILIFYSYKLYDVDNYKKEPYNVDFKAMDLNQCAKSCKETLRCGGFVLDPYDQCILFGHKVTDTNTYDYTNRDIVCDKKCPISKFKFNSGITRLDKIKNAIYDCKSRSRYAQIFSNGDKLKNISGLVNYDLNNTLIDYDLVDVGPLNKKFI